MGSTRLTLSGTELCATCRAHDRCEIERRANNTPKCREAQIYERLAAYEDTGPTPEGIQQMKLMLAGKTIARLTEINDRVIVFVRFVASIPADAHRITGAEKAWQRKETIESFRRGEFKVLYITYGCGAFGLNLQFCKNMIFAEHTWDYAVREQAEARIYRMGQGDRVTYYDMICTDVGLETLIFNCISRKGDMLKTVKEEIKKCKGGAKEWVKRI